MTWEKRDFVTVDTGHRERDFMFFLAISGDGRGEGGYSVKEELF